MAGDVIKVPADGRADKHTPTAAAGSPAGIISTGVKRSYMFFNDHGPRPTRQYNIPPPNFRPGRYAFRAIEQFGNFGFEP